MTFIETGVSFIHYKPLFFTEKSFFLTFISKKDRGKRTSHSALSKSYVSYYSFELLLSSRKIVRMDLKFTAFYVHIYKYLPHF